jgi:hypothetical protein
MAELRTRFAPSPTGPLHLGHAFSALTGFDRARAAGGINGWQESQGIARKIEVVAQ